jgi:hypothetical protein
MGGTPGGPKAGPASRRGTPPRDQLTLTQVQGPLIWNA